MMEVIKPKYKLFNFKKTEQLLLKESNEIKQYFIIKIIMK